MNKQHKDKDIFGKAISAYYHKKDPTDIIVHSPDFEDDVIPVPYLFRGYKEMPALERLALKNTRGKVLDVGCGAGSHSLYLQNEKKLEVTSIDTSNGAIEVCKLRGLKNAQKIDFFDLKNEKFDTILLLMNGSGIIGKLRNLDKFFEHCRQILKKDGQILMDSSDLSFLFDQDEDGGIWVDAASYYGELSFSISYKGERSDYFDWLYIDYDSLELAASKHGFKCELLRKGEHYDYLARLQPKTT
ncbi:class I SAM-dependent methyltransferase [Salegentibacter chungangensis]|uniref:Class I SAM-dependent methyltransferase n=1 Tax=Salegentibacter chungangensis TaxID=1335724 RepID=A0ABW3NRD7_9FLAO